MYRLLVCLLSSLLMLHAQAYADEARAFDFSPDRLKLARGQINEVMVLGTPHLSQLPKSFDAANLSGLIDRLASWKPQVIAIESLSGLQCAYLRSYLQHYSDTVQSYCKDTSLARAATGLDVIEANVQAQRLLRSWPASPAPAQRQTLASLFMAAGEPASALVQWLRLPLDERRAGDGLSAELVDALNALRVKPNEDYFIAAPLAAKLGLERLHAMDDHTADGSSADDASADEKAYGVAIMKAWDNPYTAERKRMESALKEHLDTPDGVLALYRAYNDPGQPALVFRSDFGAALEEPSAQHFGRSYVAYWETRNLRMASNIRAAMTPPGIRALVIVGASHKGYLEAYLNQMHDVGIVSTDATLR